jgi:hypothetical protein
MLLTYIPDFSNSLFAFRNSPELHIAPWTLDRNNDQWNDKLRLVPFAVQKPVLASKLEEE